MKPKESRNVFKVRGLSREYLKFWSVVSHEAVVRTPLRVAQNIISGSGLVGAFDGAQFSEAIGRGIMDAFNELGPIYGKLAQTTLTRLPQNVADAADQLHLTRVFSDWPPVPFQEIEQSLDYDCPGWRKYFVRIDRQPIGVGSVAQVHAAFDAQGREWAIKVVKKNAAKRLLETVAAVEEILSKVQLLALTSNTKRLLADWWALTASLREEIDLSRERDNIEKVQARLAGQGGVLKIPDILSEFSSRNVLVIQRIKGTRLSDVVSGQADIPKALRKRLAQDVLRELLIQVFELGVFHADPHAGNLILQDDGSVGLFDWGLTGELSADDRTYIASLLRGVMTFDIDKITQTLQSIAEQKGIKVNGEKLRADLVKIAAKIKARVKKPNPESDEVEEKSPASLQSLVGECLKVAARHRIPVPSGLVMMAKSLITIEGLARGIDPNVSFKMIAAPVLLRAARPKLGDVFQFAKRFFSGS